MPRRLLIALPLVLSACAPSGSTRSASPQDAADAAAAAASEAAVAASEAAVEAAAAASEAAAVSSDTGIICVAAILHAVSEFGRRCRSGQNPAMANQLNGAIAKADTRILEDPRWTRDALARFIRTQAGGEETDKEWCGTDARMLYAAFAADPGSISRMTDAAVARPGPATWGTCL